jgi:hypothetical protein
VKDTMEINDKNTEFSNRMGTCNWSKFACLTGSRLKTRTYESHCYKIL